jgi:hypothetical protein
MIGKGRRRGGGDLFGYPNAGAIGLIHEYCLRV